MTTKRKVVVDQSNLKIKMEKIIKQIEAIQKIRDCEAKIDIIQKVTDVFDSAFKKYGLDVEQWERQHPRINFWLSCVKLSDALIKQCKLMEAGQRAFIKAKLCLISEEDKKDNPGADNRVRYTVYTFKELKGGLK